VFDDISWKQIKLLQIIVCISAITAIDEKANVLTGIRAVPNVGANVGTTGGINSAILRYTGASIGDPTTTQTPSVMPLLEVNLQVSHTRNSYEMVPHFISSPLFPPRL
jgi:hypothetical protein